MFKIKKIHLISLTTALMCFTAETLMADATVNVQIIQQPSDGSKQIKIRSKKSKGSSSAQRFS